MSYPRGYKLYEPIDPMNPNLSTDYLIKTFTEGVDYLVGDTSISFEETLVNSTYLNGGVTEYRYFVPFDDENVGIPSNVFSLLNLMPPTNVSLSTVEFDEIKVSYTNAEFASGYRYSLTNKATGGVTQGALPLNGSIISLEPNTLYELKLSSLNEKNESTEWSNTSQTTTYKIFLLTSTITSRNIKWDWEHGDDALGVSKFELINTDNNEVLYQGLNKTFSAQSPVRTHNNKVIVTYNSGSTRQTRLVTSTVFNDDNVKSRFGQDTTIDNMTRSGFDFHVYRDNSVSTTYNISFYIDYMQQLTWKNAIYNDKTRDGSYRLSYYNYRNDNHQFRQGSQTDGQFKSYVKIDSYQSLTKQISNKLFIFNNRSDARLFDNQYFRDFKYQPPIKSAIVNSLMKNIPSKITTMQDSKILVQPKLDIRNSRTTQYGLKIENYNFMKTLVTKGRQKLHNPTIPFGIDNVDVVFNATVTNIDIQSQINKVRILCLGDSITAGAPSYDPQYGGTVWMPDLITGKTKTRNVIESSYPYWLQTRLGIADFEVINEGSGRRTSTEVEYHARRQMEQYKPEYVIIMIGTNDIFSAQDSGASNLANVVNTTLNNIRKTVDTVRAFNGIPILGTQLPRNSIVPQEAKNALRSLNAGIKNLGIEYGMDIIDWYNEFVQKDSTGMENGVLRYDLTVDDTHPSVEGYKKMAYTINLGIFNSFRASLRLFSDMLGNDVDYSKEETKIQPDPYTLHYSIRFPELRRLQRYVFSKYIKNTGNSWGLFTIQLDDHDDVCEIWDEKNQVWTDYLVGQLAPNQIMELRMRYILPATGTNKVVDFNIDYIVKR